MPGESGRVFRVLIVDATNTGRSAAGERILRRHLAARCVPESVVRVTSAGLDAEDGARMQDHAARVIERHGGNPRGFAARSLSAAMVDATDLFVCGTGVERDELLLRYPRARGRSFTLSELAHLYEAVVPAAPLHEHPALLERRRRSEEIPDDWDLPDWEDLEERAAAVGERIDEAAGWVADIWAAMAPTDAGPADLPGVQPACTLDVFGVPVAVHCSGSESGPLATLGHRIWSRCVTEPREVEATVTLVVDPDPEVLSQARADGALAHRDVDTALHHLTSAVTVRAIERRAGALVMLHGAGLASPDGSVVGFVAPSGTGKTTLARTLGAHYGYVTDETLAIDAGRTVLPYPKPLSVIGAAGGIKEQWGPESLDLVRPPAGRLRLVRLALLDRDPEGPDVPEIEDMPLLHGLAALAEQVSYLSRLPRQLHTLADLVDSVGGLVRIRYRNARDVLPLMPSLLEGAA